MFCVSLSSSWYLHDAWRSWNYLFAKRPIRLLSLSPQPHGLFQLLRMKRQAFSLLWLMILTCMCRVRTRWWGSGIPVKKKKRPMLCNANLGLNGAVQKARFTMPNALANTQTKLLTLWLLSISMGGFGQFTFLSSPWMGRSVRLAPANILGFHLEWILMDRSKLMLMGLICYFFWCVSLGCASYCASPTVTDGWKL